MPFETLIGKTIGRYQIVELLGRGGMAEVYKAYQPSLDRHVAVKIMHSFLAEEGDFFERFTREAKNVAALNHPNIIQIHDFDHEGDVYYMVMEFVDGGTLKQRNEGLAKSNQRMPLNEAMQIIKDVGAALAYSHKRSMIHRDIKPANVMLGTHRRAILTDFGIAKIVSSAKFTASGSILGTPAYISPEQGLGQPGDHRSDIYSFGVMMYQLLTGRLPYDADTPVGVILKHVNEQLPPPRSINPALPIGLENIIIKALAKDPAQRYQTVDELLVHLNDLSAAEAMPIPTESTVRLPADRVKPDTGDTLYAPGKMALGATPTEILPAIGKQEKKRNWVPAIIGALVLLLLIGVGTTLAAMGGFLFVNQPTATNAVAAITSTNTAPPTPTEPAGTPTQDVVLLALTSQASTSIAQEATILALQATATPTATPDFTLTAAACPFSYTITNQTPKDGTNIIINRSTKITLTISNTGQCAWDEGTALNFIDGDAIHETSPVPVGAVQPGQSVSAVINLRPTQAKQNAATWAITLGDGEIVGEPFVLNYRSVVAPTAGPPTNTAVPPTAVPPTQVTGGGGPIQSNATFRGCRYLPPSTDYECDVTISVRGGVPPYTVFVNSNEESGPASPTQDFGTTRKSRRCITLGFTWTVYDAANQVGNFSANMDPTTATLFNNNTEVCGLG